MHFQEQQLQHNITKRMKLQEAIVATRSAPASAKQINHQEEKTSSTQLYNSTKICPLCRSFYAAVYSSGYVVGDGKGTDNQWTGRYWPVIFQEELSKITKILSQESLCSGRDPTTSRIQVLLEPPCSVFLCVHAFLDSANPCALH